MMPGKKLDDEGVAALDAVTAADTERRRVRAEAEEAARKLVAAAVADADRVLGVAVHRALALGVPHRRVGMVGMGTSDWGIVDRYAELGAGVEAA